MVLLFWKENEERTEGWRNDCELRLTTAADEINQETSERREWGEILSPAEGEESSTFSKASLKLSCNSYQVATDVSVVMTKGH